MQGTPLPPVETTPPVPIPPPVPTTPPAAGAPPVPVMPPRPTAPPAPATTVSRTVRPQQGTEAKAEATRSKPRRRIGLVSYAPAARLQCAPEGHGTGAWPSARRRIELRDIMSKKYRVNMVPILAPQSSFRRNFGPRYAGDRGHGKQRGPTSRSLLGSATGIFVNQWKSLGSAPIHFLGGEEGRSHWCAQDQSVGLQPEHALVQVPRQQYGPP